jgi:hypothetical protein
MGSFAIAVGCDELSLARSVLVAARGKGKPKEQEQEKATKARESNESQKPARALSRRATN